MKSQSLSVWMTFMAFMALWIYGTYRVLGIVGQSLSEAVHVGMHVANNSDWPAMLGCPNGSHARQGYWGFEFSSKRSTHPSDLEFNTHINKPWMNAFCTGSFSTLSKKHKEKTLNVQALLFQNSQASGFFAQSKQILTLTQLSSKITILEDKCFYALWLL